MAAQEGVRTACVPAVSDNVKLKHPFFKQISARLGYREVWN